MTLRRITSLGTASFVPALLLTACLQVRGQTPAAEAHCSQPASPSSTASKPCPVPKSISEQFPFPGEAPEAKPQDQPEAPKTSTGSQIPKDKFPYPGESPDATPAPNGAGSGQSSSSSSPTDVPPDVDGRPGLKDEGTQGSTRSSRRRLRPPAQKILSDDERVEEDLSVAHFYQQSGNLNGAYMRAKDAVKIEPQASDAHLALAEIAQKMGKRDEAATEYTRYLELDPDGDGAKAARKSLDKLKP